MTEQPEISRDRFDRQDVKPSAGKYSTIECRKQIVGVDDRAARRIHEPGPQTHALEERAAYHASRLGRERRVDADEIARGEERAGIGCALDVGWKVPVDEIRIASCQLQG